MTASSEDLSAAVVVAGPSTRSLGVDGGYDTPTVKLTPTSGMVNSKKRPYRMIAWYFAASVIAAVFIAPILSTLAVALTAPRDLFAGGWSTILPLHPTLANFRSAFDAVPFLEWYKNSIIVATLFTLGQLLSTSLTAYALVRIRFPGRGILLMVVVITLMIPFQTIMIPLFELMTRLHWINTLYPLWVPAFFGDITGAFGIFLLRQAFMSIPVSLADAARVDGASHGSIFYKVYLPLVRPQLAVVAVFSFMNSWNDFVRPIIYITGQQHMTVTGGLSNFQTAFNVQWGPLMAGTLMAMFPTLIVYMFAQRLFRQGVMTVGVRG